MMFGLGRLLGTHNGKNWIYVVLRLVSVLGMSLAIYAERPREIVDFASVSDIAIPAMVGLIGALTIAVMAAIRSTRPYIPLAVLPLDWALVGAYTYFAVGTRPTLLLAVLTIVMISGILRLGSTIGTIQAVGTMLVTAMSMAVHPELGWSTFAQNPYSYLPALIIAIISAFMAIVWYNVIDEENDLNRREVRREIQRNRTRLEQMRERTKSYAELAARFSATLNYDKILDVALDISRLSLHPDPRDRVVSMALMVVNAEELSLVTGRGISHYEEGKTFYGREGLLAGALQEGKPIIIHNGSEDPELSMLNSFVNVRTTLAIPLRANYETYGVLVFGTTGYNAINEDHVDTLATIGTQATLALQNSVLYSNLREEKERIIRIEKNGRKSLVRDLHDIPTQTVSAVAMQLSILPMVAERTPDKLREETENIRQMALRATEEIRHVMFTIRPLSLENSGLLAALKQLSEKMMSTYKQKMHVDLEQKVEEYLDESSQSTLFYLIEEAANNARKYAQAEVIQVKGTIVRDEIVIRVRDNGKGFDLQQVYNDYEEGGSFGMVNMRERAELINATFELDSEPGRGTLVMVRVPIYDRNIEDAPAEDLIIPRKNIKKKKKEYSGPLSPAR